MMWADYAHILAKGQYPHEHLIVRHDAEADLPVSVREFPDDLLAEVDRLCDASAPGFPVVESECYGFCTAFFHMQFITRPVRDAYEPVEMPHVTLWPPDDIFT